MNYSLTAPVFDYPAELREGAEEFVSHVLAQPLDDWFPAPLSKRGNRLKGDTAAGQAIETFLKIAVNNSDGPDIPKGRIEVKGGREDSGCATTLLTKAPCFPKGANRQMVTNFGYPCEIEPETTTRLMVCLSAAKSTTPRAGNNVFDINVSDDRFTICANDVVVAAYERPTLLARAQRKLGGILAHFKAESRYHAEGYEEFRITSLNLHWGFSEENFWSGIKSGNIVVEPRLKLVGTKCRDRGTAFRATDPSALYAFSASII